MARFWLVELCPIDHPKAEKIKKENEDLGHHVYRFRGWYLLIIGGDRVWTFEDGAPAG